MADELQQPKKPAGGAFGQYLTEHRAAFMKECAGKPITAVTKLASTRFKEISENEKAKYQEQFKAAQEKFNKDMEAFLAAGGEKKAKKRKGKDDEDGGRKKKKPKKDPDAPKKPAGGGYGQFMAKNRAEFAEATKGQPVSAVTKLGGQKWSALSEEEKKPFNEQFLVAMAEYKEKMKSYEPPEPKVDPKEEAKKAKQEAKDAKAEAKEEAKQAKQDAKEAKAAGKESKPEKATAKSAVMKAAGRGRGRGRGRGAAAPPANKVELTSGVASKAEKLGYTEQLTKLANRQDIIDSGKTQTQMLTALENSGGLIHPAKRALLGE